MRGYPVQGAQKRSSCGAIEGALNTQTPEQASKNPVSFPEDSKKARIQGAQKRSPRVAPFRGTQVTLCESSEGVKLAS